MNQNKREADYSRQIILNLPKKQKTPNEDLRLKTFVFSQVKNVSSKVKVIFILKTFSGLHIKEISECTLLSQDAIYKSISRAKKDFQQATKDTDFDLIFEQVSENQIAIVEEILYAVLILVSTLSAKK